MAFLKLLPNMQTARQKPEAGSDQVRVSLRDHLFAWRLQPSFGWLEWITLASYCFILTRVLPVHAPWSDEAQAWLIARDSSLWQILAHRLHYEGAPPLWHLLLHLFYLAHGTYAGIGWFGALFAVAGMAVWLRWSPFPLPIRLLLPFTFFFLYQYAIIARSYTLFALLAFTLCALYLRKQHIVFAFVAALLANLCIQGLLLAGIILCFYLVDLYRAQTFAILPDPKQLASFFIFDLYRTRRMQTVPQQRRQLLLAGMLFTGLVVIGVFVAYPAPDNDFPAAVGGGGVIHDLMAEIIEHLPRSLPDSLPDLYLYPLPDPPKPSVLTDPMGWAAWQIDYRPIVDDEGHYGSQSFGSQVLEFVIGALSQVTWPISTSNLFACTFFAVLITWLYRRRALYALLPWAVLIFVGQILWVADQHAGMLLIALLAGIWIAVERPQTRAAPFLLERSFLALFVLMLLLQMQWSWYCIHREFDDSYDPSQAMAGYMKEHPVARTAGFHFYITAIEPYFKTNPFFNTRTTYWAWSYFSDPDSHHRPMIAAHPDRVILTEEFPGTSQMRNQWAPVTRDQTPEEEQILPRDWVAKNLWARGYRETHRFCGERFARLGTSERDCDIVFEPGDTLQAHSQIADSSR